MTEKTRLPKPIPERSDAQQETAARVWTRFQRFAWDIGGIILLTFAVMTLMALLIPRFSQGVLLSWWIYLLKAMFGWGSIWVVIAAAALGFFLIRLTVARDALAQVRWRRVFALELTAFASLGLLAALGGISFARAEAGLDGGRIGWAIAYLFAQVLDPLGMKGPLWQVPFLGGLIILGLVVGLGWSRAISSWIDKQLMEEAHAVDVLDQGGVSVAPLGGQRGEAQAKTSRRKRPSLPAQFRKNFRIEDEEQAGAGDKKVSLARDEALPPLDILVNERASRPDQRHINLTAGLIEKTLAEFGIPARVVGFQVGPTVTQFAVEPGFVEKLGGSEKNDANRMKVRVSQISALRRDLALALSAERLRIQAPVPGRPYVGIEVPNARSSIVRMRPILETEAFNKIGSPLAVALGRDVSGQPVAADLARMPHLLIAGTTGSGKSVCIAALTACLVMNNSPDDLRLVMIDPKMVELVRFNGLPHLYGKVETDLERILGVLRWTVAEMDRRYRLLEKTRSRHLDSYNRKARRRKGEHPLPKIVVFIDELADLMMAAPEQTEPALVRLAQMARATGIHLVVATQRPSTDVVTGLIKANFPARMSFAVASSTDSRVILDASGAETLLGHGDMLFLPPDASAPIRAQGVMVTDREVEHLITFWQKATPGVGDEAPPWEEMLQQEALYSERDALVEKAVSIIKQTQRASVSLLQRRLRVGYPRAARLMDEMEDLGIVGPSLGGGREREVLIGPDDEDDIGD